MNAEMKRFLCLNSIVTGVNLDKIYSDDEVAAVELGFKNVNEYKEVINRINELYSVTSVLDNYSILTRVILNYLRMQDYAMVFVPNAGKIYLSGLVEEDRLGKIEDSKLIDFVLSRQIEKAVKIDDEGKCRLEDGTLYMTSSNQKKYNECLTEAYELFKYGPSLKSKSVVYSETKRFLIDYFITLGASTCARIIKDIASKDINPLDYSKTLLNVPRYYDIWSRTGCIISHNIFDGTIYFMMEQIDNPEKTKVNNLSKEELKQFIVNDLRDLSNLKYDRNGGGSHIGV